MQIYSEIRIYHMSFIIFIKCYKTEKKALISFMFINTIKLKVKA